MLRILVLFLMILSVFTLFFISSNLITLLLAIVFVVLYILIHRKARIEYEFCYFSDDMDVSIIYNRARRKKKMHFTMEELQYAVKRVEQGENNLMFCNRAANPSQIYTLMLSYNSKRTALVTELDPGFVKVLEQKRKLR